MTDHLDFEARLAERLRARGAIASRPFDAAAIAHQAVLAGGRSPGIGSLGRPSTHPAVARRHTLMVAAALLIALVLAVAAAVGARLTSVQPAPPDLVPRPAAWIATGPMSEARRDPTLTLLLDGRVLAAGGDRTTDEKLATAELYDPASGSWTLAGTMTERVRGTWRRS